jgi:hypothetical protein
LKSVRVGVAALAFAGLVAQPVVANAGIYYCPPKVVATPSGGDLSLGIFWAVTFFLCAGMGVGKQDKWAREHHGAVTGQDRAGVFLSCIFPPIGFKRNHDMPLGRRRTGAI